METGVENVVLTTTTTGTNPETVEQTTTAANPEPKKDEKPVNAEVEKLKAALSRANGEAAEYKRQLREKQTEAERAEADRIEQEKAMREELETLRKEKAVTEYTNRCLALDFGEELAAKTANAIADNDMDSMFEYLKAFVAETKTRLENEALNRQPALSAGVPPTTKATADAEMEKLRRYAGLPAHR